MVRPAERRRMAEWACGAYRLTERRACAAVGMSRSTFRYRSRKPLQQPLRRRIRELAGVHTYAGYRRLHVYLRREGWKINHKRVYRLYQEDGLALRKRARRRRSVVARGSRPEPTAVNQYWSMDFMHDALAGGGTLRLFTLIDVYSRECLALKPATGFTGAAVAEILSCIAKSRALPKRILVDNGTEFTSKALDAWAYWNKVKLDFSRPGKPGDKCPCRGLQQPGPARVPFATLVSQPRGGGWSPRGVERRVQQRPAPWEFAADDSGPVPGRSHLNSGSKRAENSRIEWIREWVRSRSLWIIGRRALRCRPPNSRIFMRL
jgi:putative transposase